MTNLFRCITCDKTITSEEANKHSCQAPITRYKTLEASSYFTVKNENDEQCIVIDAFNGTGYTFIVKQPNLMPLPDNQEDDRKQVVEADQPRSDENLHREQPDGDSPVPLHRLCKVYVGFLTCKKSSGVCFNYRLRG